MKIRGNRQIWGLAEFLHEIYNLGIKDECPSDAKEFYESSSYLAENHRNRMYDKAHSLLKKINNNEFTGEDNHE